MSLPPNTHDYLYREGSWSLPGYDDGECEGATFHSPTPLFVHDTLLVLRAWWPEDCEHAYWVWAPKALLCGTCRDNLTILLQMYHRAEGNLPWEIRREFGNKIRALAHKGWDWFSTHRPAESVGLPR